MLLVRLRTRAGIGKQSELARLLGVGQQTVSRWERGLSRPRVKEIPKLASVLRADRDVLLEAAGYTNPAVAATFDRPFPINALPPESFERFCHYFLERMYENKRSRSSRRQYRASSRRPRHLGGRLVRNAYLPMQTRRGIRSTKGARSDRKTHRTGNSEIPSAIEYRESTITSGTRGPPRLGDLGSRRYFTSRQVASQSGPAPFGGHLLSRKTSRASWGD